MRLDYRVTPVTALRADLLAANFSVETLTTLWGKDASAALHRGQRLPAVRALVGPAPLATLARLFVLGLPVNLRQIDEALPSLTAAGAIELNLIDASGNPRLDLRPYSFVDTHGVGSWWIASDLGELATGAPLRADHVLGVGGASLTLSGLMLDRRVGSALDLGTGCGIQAMHAARHADRVVATDISARALEFAAFNARLNNFHNIEFRLGSLFDPVAGERFDHIVSNPPFVITPRVAAVPSYQYRDGGMVGDSLIAAVVAGIGEHLAPGGVAQLLANWEYSAVEGGLDRVVGWLRATGLGGWAIEREVQDVALYAETWIRDGGTRPGAAFDKLSAAWLDDFEARGVTAVGFGYLALQAGSTLDRAERLHGPVASGLGPHVGDSLASHDRLEELDDDALGRQHLTVAPDVTEERHYWPGAEHPTVMTLRQGSGFQRQVPLETGMAALVGACDGELSVRAIVAAIAQLLELDEAELSVELLPGIRELVFCGFLTLQRGSR